MRDRVRWPEPEKPGIGEKIVSYFVIGLLWLATAYFGAHFLVANGVGCG